MRTLGLLGGMSWESTVTYYQLINQHVRATLGGLRSAPCILYSFDFAEIEALQRRGDWHAAAARLGDAASALRRAGAQGLVLCTNTMHFAAAGLIEAAAAAEGKGGGDDGDGDGLPFLHIVDPTAERVVREGFRTVGLLGTRFTMEEDFYRARLRERFGLEAVVPDDAGRGVVHDVIYQELCRGVVRDESRERYRAVVAGLKASGAECLILGCTEIGLLLGEGECCGLKMFDTTKIHAIAAAEWAMDDPQDEAEEV